MVDLPAESQRERLRRHGINTTKGEGRGLLTLFDPLDLSELDLMAIRDLVQCGPDPADACLIGMLGLLFSALGEGSLCLDLDRESLQERLQQATDPDVSILLDGFIRRMDEGRYDCLVDRIDAAGFRPLVLDETSGKRLLYFQKFHHHERRLKQRLESFLSLNADARLTDDTIRAVIDELYCDDAVIRKGVGKDPIIRDSYQVAAIRAALTAPLLVVSGGPGTGKTSLLVNMLRALVRTGTDPSRLLLAAPTGRAAQRMSETLTANLATIKKPGPFDRQLEGLSGSTLHKLLVYSSRTGGFLYGRQRPIEADVIAVDEVSMVDVVMMDRLFQAIDPAHTRVILIGDKDQLPSVEAGSVLADLSPSSDSALASHFVVLRNVYRSAGKLLQLAQAINAGQAIRLTPMAFTDALTMQDGDWAFVSAGVGGVTNGHLDQWISHHYLRKEDKNDANYVALVHEIRSLLGSVNSVVLEKRTHLFDLLFSLAYRCRILTVLRHGRNGAIWINDRIARGLRPHLDPGGMPDDRLFNGALIMITRNDYQRGLFNGDVGVVIRDPLDGMYQAYFKRSEGVVAFPATGLPDWELAFAMTVHKSQGSEFEDTWLLLPEDPSHRLLSREIVYTAATRASHRLIVYGTANAFHASLDRKIHRQSGLMA